MNKIKNIINLVVDFYTTKEPSTTVSALRTGTTGINCIKSFSKAITCQSPVCKTFYTAGALLSVVAFSSNSSCLLYGSSSQPKLPLPLGTIGYVSFIAGELCTKAGDSLNPTAKPTDAVIDKMVDALTKGIDD